MSASVTFEKTTYNALPYEFEAGTPHIAGVIGLGVALDYLSGLGLDRVAAHERELLTYGTATLQAAPGVRIIGTARDKASVLSFIVTILDHAGIAVRAGHHCAMPVMRRFGVPATVRASLAFYNTREELDALGAGLREVREIFG